MHKQQKCIFKNPGAVFFIVIFPFLLSHYISFFKYWVNNNETTVKFMPHALCLLLNFTSQVKNSFIHVTCDSWRVSCRVQFAKFTLQPAHSKQTSWQFTHPPTPRSKILPRFSKYIQWLLSVCRDLFTFLSENYCRVSLSHTHSHTGGMCEVSNINASYLRARLQSKVVGLCWHSKLKQAVAMETMEVTCYIYVLLPIQSKSTPRCLICGKPVWNRTGVSVRRKLLQITKVSKFHIIIIYWSAR